MRKKGNNKETFRIFDKVKKTLNSQLELKVEYEQKLSTVHILTDPREEANFLIDFLISKYKSEFTDYITKSGSKSLRWLQDALTKTKKNPLGIFSTLCHGFHKLGIFKVLKLLSKNGIACFNAICINVVLRELLLRYDQFKSQSSLAFTEDEKQFYQKMMSLENNTTSWLQNIIDQTNQSSKPINLKKDDAHIPADEPSRLLQYSFILRVLQALGCSAQQVNIRVGMVFEGEIELDSPKRRYTQTTEDARGPLANNRWKVYEFLYPNDDSHTDYDTDHRDENKRDDGFSKSKQNKKPSPNRVERSYSKEDWQECLSLLLPSDNNDVTAPSSASDNIMTLVNTNYSIYSLDEVFQDNQIEPKDLAGNKRLFDKISTEEEEEEEENSSPPKRFHGKTMDGPHW
eukprot:gene14574-16147_t